MTPRTTCSLKRTSQAPLPSKREESLLGENGMKCVCVCVCVCVERGREALFILLGGRFPANAYMEGDQVPWP